MTLGDKIRAMQLGLPVGGTAHAALDRAAAIADEHEAETLQSRVDPWMQACFGPEISADKLERGDRLLEEVFELLQSGDYPRERVAALEEYVWSRDVGEPHQEVGGVMITLAAYCLAHGLDMHKAGEDELARIWTKVEKIRAKQAAKPKGSALPIALTARPADEHQATIAAAYEDAASIPDGELVYEGHFVRWPCYHKGDGNVHVDGPQAELARCFSAAIRARVPADARAALELRDAQMRAQGRIEAGAVFATTGAEERYVADTENACPACGGSGHKDDARATLDRIKDEARKERRELLGVECPRCKIVRPKTNASILLPGQRCRVDGYRDPRPNDRLTEKDAAP